MICKRMEAQPKLQLIHQLDALPVAAQWEAITSSAEEDEGTVGQMTSFLNSLAFEIIDSVKRIENQFISMQACILIFFMRL
jgi:hypothetical protein